MTTALDTYLEPRISIHGMNSLEASGLTKAECQAIRAVVCKNNLMDHDDYRMKQPAHPFLQSYDEHSGWVLIEFWGRDYLPYVNYLSTRIPQAIQEWHDLYGE